MPLEVEVLLFCKQQWTILIKEGGYNSEFS